MVVNRNFWPVLILVFLGACTPPPDTGNPGSGGGDLHLTIQPDGGAYQAPVTVKITADTQDTLIRYTLDGTQPGENAGILYDNTAGFVLQTNAVIKVWGKVSSTGKIGTLTSQPFTFQIAKVVVPQDFWGRWAYIPPSSTPTSGFLKNYFPSFRFDGGGIRGFLQVRSDGTLLQGKDTAPEFQTGSSSFVTTIDYKDASGATALTQTFDFSWDGIEKIYRVEPRDSTMDNRFSLYQPVPDPVTAKGRLLVDSGLSSRFSLGGLGDLDLLVENVEFPSDSETVTTDSDGNFQVESLVTGEIYVVTPADPGQLPPGAEVPEIPLVVTEADQDAGSFPVLGEGENYRISLEDPDFPPAEELGAGAFVSVGEPAVTFPWFATNIGNIIGTDVKVTLEPQPGLSVSADTSAGAFSSLEPQGRKAFSFKSQWTGPRPAEPEFFSGVTVTLKNSTGNIWTSVLPIKVYRDRVFMGAKDQADKESAVKVQYFLPSGRAFYDPVIQPAGYPFVEGGLLSVRIFNDYANKTYMLGLFPQRKLPLLPSTGSMISYAALSSAFEPNDSITAAKTLYNGEIILAGGPITDVDYFKLGNNPSPKPEPRWSLYAGPDYLNNSWSKPWTFKLTNGEWQLNNQEPLAVVRDPDGEHWHGLFTLTYSNSAADKAFYYSKGTLSSTQTGNSWQGTGEILPGAKVAAYEIPFAGLTVDSSGTVHVVYTSRPDTSTNEQLMYVKRAPDGSWGTPELWGEPGYFSQRDQALEIRTFGNEVVALVKGTVYRRYTSGSGTLRTISLPVPPSDSSYTYAPLEGRLIQTPGGKILAVQYLSKSASNGFTSQEIQICEVLADGVGLNLRRSANRSVSSDPSTFELVADKDSSKAWLLLPETDTSVGNKTSLFQVNTSTLEISSTPHFQQSLTMNASTWPSLFPARDSQDKQVVMASRSDGLYLYTRQQDFRWSAQEALDKAFGTAGYLQPNLIRVLDQGPGWTLFKVLISGSTYGLLLVEHL